MNFETLQPLLVAWVKSLTETDVALFENEPRPRHNGTLVLLSWVSIVTRGIEDQRYEVADVPIPESNLTPQTIGLRSATLQISIETLDQRPGAPNAVALAERFRSRVRKPSSLALLEEMNLGLINVGAARKADYKVDQRWISRQLVEVGFNATAFETDTAITSIERAKVTSTIQNAAGDALPPSLQAVAEIIPE